MDAPAVIVARAPADAPAVQLPSVDATGEPAAPPVDAAVAIAPRPRVDAGLAHHARDAAEPAVAIADAALPVATPPAVDAGPVAPPPPKIGWIVVRSDRWCDVTVDGGESKGRNGGPPIEVTPGHHVVLCKQTGLDTGFRQEVDVVAGQTARVDGKVVRLKP